MIRQKAFMIFNPWQELGAVSFFISFIETLLYLRIIILAHTLTNMTVGVNDAWRDAGNLRGA